MRDHSPMPVAHDRPILDLTALNRATLTRQLLLRPERVDVVAAVHRIGGLQAQEPASPHIGLWTRVTGFAAQDLDAALARRDVVKATLMRATLHVATAVDYAALQPAVSPMGQAIRRQDRSRPPDPEQLARLAKIAAAFTTEPQTLGELRDHLAGHDADADELVWWLRRHMTFIHAPDATVPWSFGRRPRLVEAAAWLMGVAFADPPTSVVALVRRHLAAFGPATAADIAAWSGVAVGRLRPGIEALDAEGALWHGGDERGRALIDLVDAPRPPASTPAPPRLLPMWDSVLLAHQDRTRVISDADRALVIARNGDTLPTFLVDGRVAGTWWADPGPGGRTTISIEPFRQIDRVARVALESEAERLAAFVEPVEPFVYRRYQRWRPRS